ncbi:chalcone isomerase family protein [Alteromonas ponticola]|uniref:Chalcone isomerase domain-containing protein n=1 Tax=Alteromonas ponticola TaxID=2720613 RepID=A0ABX1R033_9ALTE|nr:chalcone isomerase family protein [Alteromonas ponticola]NMH59276.1 hypothetical protein [Alteromonas ponticola]
MKIFLLRLITVTLVGCPFAASADDSKLQQALSHVPKAELVGEGQLSYMFWDIYDASLYAPEGNFKADKPFVLSLSYLRDFTGKEIAERSIKVMGEQQLCESTHFPKWEDEMKDIFPDMREGDLLTGVRDSQGNARFFHNGSEVGVIETPDFTQCFFAIWLDEKTSEPELRQQLLGNANDQ